MKNRKQMENGALPKEVPVEDLFKEHVSKPCNPNLANVFFKCGMIESWARGFNKITRYCEEENAKLPVIDLSLGGVTARCYASDGYLALMNEYEKAEKFTENDQKTEESAQESAQKTEKVPKRCPKSAQKTYLAIVKNPRATIEELSKELGISERAVKKHQKLLKDAELITRQEGRKSGHWKIIEK